MFQRVTVVQTGLVLPRGATTIPQNGVKPLYVISGGVIEILGLFGVVTTVIAGGANATKFQFKPSGQTAMDLCATGEINALAVGQQIAAVFPVATALATGWGTPVAPSNAGFRVGPGTIDLNCAAVAGTGAFRFGLRYQAVDPGAAIAIA